MGNVVDTKVETGDAGRISCVYIIKITADLKRTHKLLLQGYIAPLKLLITKIFSLEDNYFAKNASKNHSET